MWLSWDNAALLAAALGVVGLGARRARDRALRATSAFAVEASLVAALYSVWQFVGQLPHRGVGGAMGHARWIVHVQRLLLLPSERVLQREVLGHPLIVQAANVFYAVVHVPALGIFLVWLFARHRSRYPRYRNALAVLTFTCFLIHLIPVAPPRLLAGSGFVDTAVRYHQSVYGPVGTGISDQVSAMPSLHLAWACLIAVAVIQVSPSRWRWLVLAHPVLTMYVVVVTGNHFWLDGIAAAILVAASLALVDGAGRLRRRRRAACPAPEQPRPTLQRA